VLISIVVPVYNEEQALVDLGQGVRQELTRLGQPWEIIFIYDSRANAFLLADRE
jgi:glycosyltransferase involved in cell wall biosynthesis